MSRSLSMKEMLQAARQRKSAAAAPIVQDVRPVAVAPVAAASRSQAQQAEVTAYSTQRLTESTHDATVHYPLAQHELTASPLPPSAFLVPDFISEAEAAEMESLIATSPACMWHQLKRRRLQMWGGFPSGQENFKPDPLPSWQEQIIDRICSTLTLEAAEKKERETNDGSDASSAGPLNDTTTDEASAAAALPSSGRPFFPPASRPNHVLLNSYLPGEGILAHQDGPVYESRVAILSLGGHAVMHFYSDLAHSLPGAQHRPALSIFLPPRSLFIFTEQLYTTYFHAIEERTEDHLHDGMLAVPSDLRGQTVQRQTRISLTIRRVRNSALCLRSPQPVAPIATSASE